MNKREVLLSVVVPVYNTERYIEECVESILRQKSSNLEIILVDDGSTDRSGFLCDRLSEKNDCVKVLHIENGGIINARYAGSKASTGKWITFVDADDWISEDAYKDFVSDNSCDVIITGICRYFNSEKQIMQPPYLKEGIYNRDEIVSKILPIMLWTPRLGIWALDPSLCTKIFRREIIMEYLERASKVGSDYGEDSIVIFPMMLRAERIRISGKIYYYHRQRAGGVLPSYIQDEKFFLKLYKAYEYLKEQFKMTEYWDIMKGQLDCFFINGVGMKKYCYKYPASDFTVYFPIDIIPEGSQVVLYGAGKVGRQYWEQNLKYHLCDIVLWVDKGYAKIKSEAQKIENPDDIKNAEFDYVLIAVDDYYAAKEIVSYLDKCGVEKRKIVWQSVRANRTIFDDVLEDQPKI